MTSLILVQIEVLFIVEYSDRRCFPDVLFCVCPYLEAWHGSPNFHLNNYHPSLFRINSEFHSFLQFLELTSHSFVFALLKKVNLLKLKHSKIMDVTLIVANILFPCFEMPWRHRHSLWLIRKAEAWEMLTSLRLDQAM